MKKILFISLSLLLLSFTAVKATTGTIDCSNLEAWSGERGYGYGVRVVQDGKVFESIRSENDNWCKPVTDTSFWNYVGDCINDICKNYPQWQQSATYPAGAIVEHRGILFQTSVQSFCQDPLVGNPWVVINVCYTNCETAEKFNSNKIYLNNDIVIDGQGRLYIAQYWTQANPAGNNGPQNSGQPWVRIGFCFDVTVQHDCASISTPNTIKVFQGTSVTVTATPQTLPDRDCRVNGPSTQTVVVNAHTTITFDCECQKCVTLTGDCNVDNTNLCAYPSDNVNYVVHITAPTEPELECSAETVLINDEASSSNISFIITEDVEIFHDCNCKACVTVVHDCLAVDQPERFCVVPGTLVNINATPQQPEDRECRVIGSQSFSQVVNTHVTVNFHCECQACIDVIPNSCVLNLGDICVYPSDNYNYVLTVSPPVVPGQTCSVDSIKVDSNTVQSVNFSPVTTDHTVVTECSCDVCITVNHDCSSISSDPYFCVPAGTLVTINATPQNPADRQCRVVGSSTFSQIVTQHTTVTFDCECQNCVTVTGDCNHSNNGICVYTSELYDYSLTVSPQNQQGLTCSVQTVHLDGNLATETISINDVDRDHHIETDCQCLACITVVHDCASINQDSYFCVQPGSLVNITATPPTPANPPANRQCRVIGSANFCNVVNQDTTITFDCECQNCITVQGDCSHSNNGICVYPSQGYDYSLTVQSNQINGQTCQVESITLNEQPTTSPIFIQDVDADYHIHTDCSCQVCIDVVHDCGSLSTPDYFCVNPGTEVTITAYPATPEQGACRVVGPSTFSQIVNQHTTVTFDCECQNCIEVIGDCQHSNEGICVYASEGYDYTLTVSPPANPDLTCSIVSVKLDGAAAGSTVNIMNVAADHTIITDCQCLACVTVVHDCNSISTPNYFCVNPGELVNITATPPTQENRQCRVSGSNNFCEYVYTDTTVTFDCECQNCITVSGDCVFSNNGICVYPSQLYDYSLTVSAPVQNGKTCSIQSIKLDGANLPVNQPVQITDVNADHSIVADCSCLVCITVNHDCSSISSDSYFCVEPGTLVNITAYPQTPNDRSCRVRGSNNFCEYVTQHTTVNFDCECQNCVKVQGDCTHSNNGVCAYPSDSYDYTLIVSPPLNSQLTCSINSVLLDGQTASNTISLQDLNADHLIETDCSCLACITVTHDCASVSSQNYFCVVPGTLVNITATPQTLPDRSCRVRQSNNFCNNVFTNTQITFDCECQNCVKVQGDCSHSNNGICVYPSEGYDYSLTVSPPANAQLTCSVLSVTLNGQAATNTVNIQDVSSDHLIVTDCQCLACVTVTHDCASVSSQNYFCVVPGTLVNITATPQTPADRSCRVIGSNNFCQNVNTNTVVNFDCECQNCIKVQGDCSHSNNGICVYPSQLYDYSLTVTAPTNSQLTCSIVYVRLNGQAASNTVTIQDVNADHTITTDCDCKACVTVNHDCQSVNSQNYFCVTPGTLVNITATPQTPSGRQCRVIGSNNFCQNVNVNTVVNFDCECQNCVTFTSPSVDKCTFSQPNQCVYPSALADLTVQVNAPVVSGKTCKVDSISPTSPNPIVLVDIAQDYSYSASCSCTDTQCPSGSCSTAPAFSLQVTYKKCDYVVCNNKLYRSKVDGNFCNDPCAGATQWEFVQECACPTDSNACQTASQFDLNKTYKRCEYAICNNKLYRSKVDGNFCNDPCAGATQWEYVQECACPTDANACSTAPDFDLNKTYNRCDYVICNNKLYRSKVNGNFCNDPCAGATQWEYIQECACPTVADPCSVATNWDANAYYKRCDLAKCDNKVFRSKVNNNNCNDPCKGATQWEQISTCSSGTCSAAPTCSNAVSWSSSKNYKKCDSAKFKFDNLYYNSRDLTVVFQVDSDSLCESPENYIKWNSARLCGRTVYCNNDVHKSGQQYDRGQHCVKDGFIYVAKWKTTKTPGTEDPGWGSWRKLHLCQ